MNCKANEAVAFANPGSDKVIEAFEAHDTLMIVADWTDDNWVIAEFLHAVKQPNIPYYLFIPGDPTKETVSLRGLIPQQSKFIDSINAAGHGR